MGEVARVDANGISFAYLEAGGSDGPLALCLHGFPDHAPTYEALLTDLADAGFHAVAPWLRGYAPTEVPADGRYHTAALALDAIALADHFAGEEDAYLIGHDWGAGATYLAAAHAPQRFRKVVTMAVPPTQALAARMMTNPDQLKRSWYIWFFQTPFAEMAVQAEDFAFIDKLWREWSPGYRAPESFMRALKDTLGSPGSLEAAIGYYRATFGGSPLDDDLAAVAADANQGVPVPILYLHGTDDGCLGAELVVADEVKANFAAGGEVEMIDGTGHFLHVEKPEVVNPKIVAFLKG